MTATQEARPEAAGRTSHISPTARPTWNETWARIGSEDMLAAKALIEITFDLKADAAQWLGYDEQPVYASDDWRARQIGVEQGDPIFLYDEWIADVEANGRGWCSSDHSLFDVVASLLDPERPMHLRRLLGYMGSWEADVWRILVAWGTGGNNRDAAGRMTAVVRR